MKEHVQLFTFLETASSVVFSSLNATACNLCIHARKTEGTVGFCHTVEQQAKVPFAS
jgi:hypothetical protein